ncbi:MAG: hypothetical protein LBV06_00290 [Propionibacteriaceae bacterium]|jgi:hypothetical protein|nr:hypothetical protein [Propionibacteriaceae bacterium]
MIRIEDLADVVYASGSVFNGLSANRLDTRDFLATGSTKGVTSRADLALLEDLKDVAHYVASHTEQPVDLDYVIAVNSAMTRSGALIPGQLRTKTDHIGVDTPYGRH